MSLESEVLGGGLNEAKRLLREDDSLLRQIFFSVLRHHHPNLANKARKLRDSIQHCLYDIHVVYTPSFLPTLRVRRNCLL